MYWNDDLKISIPIKFKTWEVVLVFTNQPEVLWE